MNVFHAIYRRHSARVDFDPERAIPAAQLTQILEAACWAPTAHNMQNFEIVVVDDRSTLDELSRIRTTASRVFVEENHKQAVMDEAHAHSILGEAMKMTSTLLVVLYDRTRHAPASEHDVLGMMSLGCVMENMWLAATALSIGFQVQSALTAVENDVRGVLGFPETRAIGFGVRLGYPKEPADDYVRVRRDLASFTHQNRYRPKG